MPKCLLTWKTQSTNCIWKKHMWTYCVTSWKGVRTKWFGSPRWTANKHCDATSHTKNSEKSKPTCHHCKKPRHYRNQCRQLKRDKDQARNNTNSAYNNNNNVNGQTNSSSKKASNNTNANSTNNQKDRRLRSFYPPGETCDKTNHTTEKCYFGANAANRPPPGIDDRKDKTRSNREMLRTTQMGMFKLQPKL